jgi:hypothetical protein
MSQKTGLVIASALLVAGGSLSGQGLPTSQPNFVQIIIEDVKVGHEDDHSKLEAGWPAAFEKAKSPYYSLGLASFTGPLQAWFLVGFDSNAAIGDSIKRGSDDQVLAAELTRLSKADSAHINGVRTLLGAARKDLTHGAFPDLAKQRFFETSLFRVRPGHEDAFTAAGKAFGTAAARSAPNVSFRVYEIIAGMPAPAYVIISSVAAFSDFDKALSDDQAIMKGATPEEQAALQKFGAEALISAETQRFRLDPNMSYVPKEVRAQDAAFWNPKKPAAPQKPTTQE